MYQESLEVINMTGFVFMAELSTYSATARSSLIWNFSVFSNVLVSTAGEEHPYLIIIDKDTEWNTGTKSFVLNTIDKNESSIVWYDKRDYDYLSNIELLRSLDELESQRHGPEEFIMMWLNFRDRTADWDSVCERCLSNNKYISPSYVPRRQYLDSPAPSLYNSEGQYDPQHAAFNAMVLGNSMNEQNRYYQTQNNGEYLDNIDDMIDLDSPLYNPYNGHNNEDNRRYTNANHEEDMDKRPVQSVRKITIL